MQLSCFIVNVSAVVRWNGNNNSFFLISAYLSHSLESTLAANQREKRHWHCVTKYFCTYCESDHYSSHLAPIIYFPNRFLGEEGSWRKGWWRVSNCLWDESRMTLVLHRTHMRSKYIHQVNSGSVCVRLGDAFSRPSGHIAYSLWNH